MKKQESYEWFFDTTTARAIRVKKDTKDEITQMFKDWVICGLFAMAGYMVITVAFLFN